MQKPFIAVTDGIAQDVFTKLCFHPGLQTHEKSTLIKEELKPLLPKLNALIIRSSTIVDEELLTLAPNLKLVIRAGEGTDNIDKLACTKRGIKVANTPGANNNSAAEHAIALMLSLLRKIPFADSSLKQGRWEKKLFTGWELSQKKIGIIGLGRIGKLVAKRLRGFGPEIMYFDPLPINLDLPNLKRVENLQEIFQTSDIITLHVPLTPKTKNMVTKELLSLMKREAFLINTSRGGIVNEKDLYELLANKKINGAALDVFETEPLSQDSPLLKLDNVILTPHLGASTHEAQQRVGEMAFHQVQEFFFKQNLLNEVKA